MAVLTEVAWIIGVMTISFTASAFGNGANDVSNAYATSVAARTLTMPQAGILAMFTEFFGAVVLGGRVTGTIKNGIIDINRFTGTPAALVLTMGCVEFGSASWLMLATKVGFPVSTTQTVVGALVGAGISSGAQVSWGWKTGKRLADRRLLAHCSRHLGRHRRPAVCHPQVLRARAREVL